MKKLIYLVLLGISFCCLYSCSARNYANQLETERKLIKDYIKREKINVIKEEPADGVWGEKDYLEIDDNLYFHLVSAGEKDGDSVRNVSTIVMRYRRYTLDAYADTLSFWSTNDSGEPLTFLYSNTTSATCSGWYQAIGYMKYNNSEAKLICPSKLGFQDDETLTNVTPYGYDLKMLIKNF